MRASLPLLVGLAVAGLSLMVSPELPLHAQESRAGYVRPVGDPHQSRSAVVARNGIVATSHPLAAQIGVDILKAGGNAADAAIATSAAMGLLEPMSCGIGGDLFAIYWDAKTKKLYGLNASGRSPYGLTIDVFGERNLKRVPSQGLLCWSVPGCVDGWDQLRQRFGTKGFDELLEPVIAYAENGAPVPEIIGAYYAGSVGDLSQWPTTAATYLIDGRAPREGELFKNQNLAASYRAIAEHGRDAFYKGSISEQIVAFSDANGGYLKARDFADHESTWVDPVSTNYRGYDVWELPPNGQGIAVLEMLNILEGYDLASLGHNSAEYAHLFIEAKKLAFADRAKYYADPDFNDLPTATLISKAYGDRQRKRIDRERAMIDVPAGDPALEHGDTIYLCVADKDGNCCSLIQSNFHSFGSQVVPGETGFVMQNRASSFCLTDEKHVNFYAPHKRPFHTIIPAFITKDDKPWLCFGLMGGDMQPQGHVQIVLNMIDFGMNVQLAGDAARLRHSGSADPNGSTGDSSGGTVSVEATVSEQTVQGLVERGHRVVRDDGGAFGGYQAIWIDHEHGTLHGATESRKDGVATGY